MGVGTGEYEGVLRDLVGLSIGILVCRTGLAGIDVWGFNSLGCGKDALPFKPGGCRGKALFDGSAYLPGASLSTRWSASFHDMGRCGCLGVPMGREEDRVGEEECACIPFRFPRILAPSSAWVSSEVAGR